MRNEPWNFSQQFIVWPPTVSWKITCTRLHLELNCEHEFRNCNIVTSSTTLQVAAKWAVWFFIPIVEVKFSRGGELPRARRVDLGKQDHWGHRNRPNSSVKITGRNQSRNPLRLLRFSVGHVTIRHYYLSYMLFWVGCVIYLTSITKAMATVENRWLLLIDSLHEFSRLFVF